jgi:AcrR family transcriptional regulator
MSTVETLKEWVRREGIARVAAECDVDVRSLYRWFHDGDGPAQMRTRRVVAAAIARAAQRLGPAPAPAARLEPDPAGAGAGAGAGVEDGP